MAALERVEACGIRLEECHTLEEIEGMTGVERQELLLPTESLDIKVKVGDAVAKGQTVAILEAMKMENNINADREGTVVSINVEKGQSIAEGTDIITLG